jgi:hypothetical protein
MRTLRFLSAVLALLALAAAAGLPAQAKAPKAKVVGTDPEGDWGANVDPTIGPIGGPLGQDLIEASIGMADKKTVNFIIKVTQLPPNGGVPEATRYVWELAVDGEHVELDGKWTNYSRGVCDPTSGQCPPPRDPGQQPFFVRGNCEVLGNVLACEELGTVQAEFDTAAATITIPVPLKMLGAKKRSKIVGAAQSDTGFSGITAIPSAFYSQTSMPFDMLALSGVFTVPKK